MTNKRAIVIGVSAIAAVLVVAVLAYGFGSDKMVKQEQGQKGNGMAEKLEFKNPVTFELLDKDGNVVSRTVVYNAITAQGKAYIYDVLGGSSPTIKKLNRMVFVDGTGDNKPLVHSVSGQPQPDLTNSMEANCTPSTEGSPPNKAKCVAIFNFASDYTTTAIGNLNLESGAKLQVGYHDNASNTFTEYFEVTTLGSGGIPVANATYSSLRITWEITVQ